LIDPTGGSTPVRVSSVDAWDLDLAKDRVDVTCFQDTNKQTVSGLPSYSGSLSGVWDASTTPAEVFDVIFGSVPAFLKLVPDTLDAAVFFAGLANLDGAISVSAKGAVTWSGKFDAAGPWSMEVAP